MEEREEDSACLEVPGKPQNLHTEKISSTKILVKWDAPQTTSAIDSYVLYCTLHTQQSISIVPPQTIYILEDITPNAEYNFSVFAKPKCGKGPRSDPKKDRTQAHLSSKPQSPRVEQISPTKTRISWDVPQTASAIHNYELKIDKSLTRQFSISPPNTSYHLEGLIRNTEYSISVLAKNKYGEGSCSDSKKYKTHRYPCKYCEDIGDVLPQQELTVLLGQDLKDCPPKFMQAVNALLNGKGGYIVVHAEHSDHLGNFDHKVDQFLRKLMPSQSCYHDVYRRYITEDGKHVVFHVKRRSGRRPLSILRYHTKISLNSCVLDPTQGEFQYLLNKASGTASCRTQQDRVQDESDKADPDDREDDTEEDKDDSDEEDDSEKEEDAIRHEFMQGLVKGKQIMSGKIPFQESIQIQAKAPAHTNTSNSSKHSSGSAGSFGSKASGGPADSDSSKDSSGPKDYSGSKDSDDLPDSGCPTDSGSSKDSSGPKDYSGPKDSDDLPDCDDQTINSGSSEDSIDPKDCSCPKDSDSLPDSGGPTVSTGPKDSDYSADASGPAGSCGSEASCSRTVSGGLGEVRGRNKLGDSGDKITIRTLTDKIWNNFKLKHYISAFSNIRKGGSFYCGVTEVKKTLFISEGFELDDDEKQEMKEEILNKIERTMLCIGTTEPQNLVTVHFHPVEVLKAEEVRSVEQDTPGTVMEARQEQTGSQQSKNEEQSAESKPEEGKQRPEAKDTEEEQHGKGKDGKKQIYIVEFRVNSYKHGLIFHEMRGPELYIYPTTAGIVGDPERCTVKDWLKYSDVSWSIDVQNLHLDVKK